mgnify:CR=1 FL=1
MVSAYIAYFFACIVTTSAAAETLRQQGLVVLGQYFKNHTDLAHSINNLLVTGFYLVNLGAAGFLLQYQTRRPYDGATMVEFVTLKFGIVLMLLAFAWVANVFFLTRFKCFLVKSRKAASPRKNAAVETPPATRETMGNALGNLWRDLSGVFKDNQPPQAPYRRAALPPLPMTPLIAQAAAQLRALAPPELAQADFGGFVQSLGAKMLEARSLNALRPRDQFIASPVLWNEMVYALYALQAVTGAHSVLACHYQSGEATRAQLLPVIGVVVYEELLSRL